MLPASFLQEPAGFCSCCTELLAVKARLFLGEAARPAQPLVPPLLCSVVEQHNALARYSHQTVGCGPPSNYEQSEVSVIVSNTGLK